MKMDKELEQAWENLKNLMKPEVAEMIEEKIFKSMTHFYATGKPLRSPMELLDEVRRSQPDGKLFKEHVYKNMLPFRNVGGFEMCMN